jgi:hypothetical protein
LAAFDYPSPAQPLPLTGTDGVPRRFCVLCVASWSCLLCVVAAAPPRTHAVDDDTLYRLLIDELAAILNCQGRLRPLPRNIQDVVLDAAGEPCFRLPVVDPARPASLATTLARLDRHEPGFRILWEGSVVGRSGDREMMIAAADPMPPTPVRGTSWVAIMDHDTTRTVSVAGGVRQAIRVGDRHVFLTDVGLVTEGDAVAWGGSDVFCRMPPVRMIPAGPNGLAVFASSQGPDGTQQLRLGVSAGDGEDAGHDGARAWSIRTISGLGQHAVSAVVRLHDQRWLAITDRIIEIDADWRPRDTKGVYRGRSVRVLEVLSQETTDSAILVIETRDEAASSPSCSVARLEPDGSLRPCRALPDGWRGPRGTSGWVRDASNGACGIVLGKGLARLSEQGLEWLGEGGRLAGNMKVVAADAHGRVYLREQTQRSSAEDDASPDVLWVLSSVAPDALKDADAPAVEPAPVAIWQLLGEPAAGASGDVWFLTPSPRALSTMRERGFMLHTDTSGVVTTTLAVAGAKEWQQTATTNQPPDDVQEPAVRLIRLDGPASATEYTNVALHSVGRLVAGRSAVLIAGLPGRADQDRVILVDGSAAIHGDDIHALATTHFGDMLAAAPTSTLPGVHACLPHPGAVPPPFQLLRTGDLLWVCSPYRVEVYDKGRALSVSDRLSLKQAGRLEQPRLIGPLDRGNGRRSVVLLTAPDRMERFVWITPTDAGITIELPEPPPRGFSPGVSLLDPGRFAGLPLVAADASWLATSLGQSRVWQVLGPNTFVPIPDTGNPILAVPMTDAFLARRGDHVRSGVRISWPRAWRDVPVTFSSRLDPVAFSADGRLLCFTPDGVAWLAPDPERAYVLAEQRLLPHDLSPRTFVAAVGTSAVLTATTPTGEACLVAIPQAMQGP